jgi:hypothetical protein
MEVQILSELYRLQCDVGRLATKLDHCLDQLRWKTGRMTTGMGQSLGGLDAVVVGGQGASNCLTTTSVHAHVRSPAAAAPSQVYTRPFMSPLWTGPSTLASTNSLEWSATTPQPPAVDPSSSPLTAPADDDDADAAVQPPHKRRKTDSDGPTIPSPSHNHHHVDSLTSPLHPPKSASLAEPAPVLSSAEPASVLSSAEPACAPSASLLPVSSPLLCSDPPALTQLTIHVHSPARIESSTCSLSPPMSPFSPDPIASPPPDPLLLPAPHPSPSVALPPSHHPRSPESSDLNAISPRLLFSRPPAAVLRYTPPSRLMNASHKSKKRRPTKKRGLGLPALKWPALAPGYCAGDVEFLNVSLSFPLSDVPSFPTLCLQWVECERCVPANRPRHRLHQTNVIIFAQMQNMVPRRLRGDVLDRSPAQRFSMFLLQRECVSPIIAIQHAVPR